MRFQFSIDRGGTFTDVFCRTSDGEAIVLKLLSEDPANYSDAPTEGIRRILQQYGSSPELYCKGVTIDTSEIDFIRMGTTVATNALLERKGARCALITTKGFADLQLIGNQSRPRIFDLEIQRPGQLFSHVSEIDERVLLVNEDSSYPEEDVVTCRSQDHVFIEKAVDINEVTSKLRDIYESGIRSIAVCFLHSYAYPNHEELVRDTASKMGFAQISISSEIMPTIRAVPRGCTTCVDAYLTPVIKQYLASFAQGFDVNIASKVSFMQSDGGLTPMSSFKGSKAILSGPAGGVVGYAITSYAISRDLPVIGFDMGGTSTDVSRFGGQYEHIFESITAGVPILSPQLDINTVAAGGGSRLFYKDGLFVVGPESSGSHPGPVCYRKQGYLAVTDANVILGRIQPHLFPAIFGPSENEMLDKQAVQLAFEELQKEVNRDAAHQGRRPYSLDEVAYGFIRVANEAMARPIRNLTTMKGYDVTSHALGCFGGAGPQHCCAIARLLGMRKIYISKYAGILSAYGLSLADEVIEKQEPFSARGIDSPGTMALLQTKLSALEESCVAQLVQQGYDRSAISCQKYMNCRYSGTDTAIMIPVLDSSSADDCMSSFKQTYIREYGFDLMGRSVMVDDVRVRVTASISVAPHYTSNSGSLASRNPLVAAETVSVYFEGGRLEAPVYNFVNLEHGHRVPGPAIIIQNVATVIIEPHCCAYITSTGDIEIDVESAGALRIGTQLDPVYLSVFSHRFMSIAEQMGRTLQRTSISVNIKERLDFSCALFDRYGNLVANAPHLPVHLGAMSEAVRYQVKYWGSNLFDGDVLVSNHPQLAGGSHLPDITVITPVFHQGDIVFFVASRGHHADVGGIAPGSMPPHSKSLVEEGAAIVAFKLVDKGMFQEEGISDLLRAPGRIPGNFGTRNLPDNLSDLRAQVAANTRGVLLMRELIKEYGLEVVNAYMEHIQSCAERAVRDMLRSFSERMGLQSVDSVSAEDFLDDGSPIRLKITIDREAGSAVFDFSGTGREMHGNLNAPIAVTSSAVIYCLRCLLQTFDLPLNQGCLAPVDIIIPAQCLLNPSATAAIVGGNVQTSQRVTDVILKAFRACAASQGCMNNLTFGDESMGYYETIAGGAGAGPTWNGASGVHTHMTNTRITDPEILEKRYPVILRQFSLRRNSGGCGEFSGGDGVIRELEFTRPLQVSILSERRAFEPYGLNGGENGARGLNLLIRADGREINLGGKNTLSVTSGDRIQIHTPGGGAFGNKPRDRVMTASEPTKIATYLSTGSLGKYVLDQESV